MKVRRMWLLGAGILLFLPGCMKKQTKTEEAKKPSARAREELVAGTPSAVHYTPAGDGLPGARIWKSQIAFGDINGDGFDDLAAVSRLADGPWAFVTDGKGHWQAAANDLPREPFCGGGVAFADVNNDGKLDLAIADHCKGVFVFLGDGAGNWTMAASGLPSIGAEDVSLGDFDNDGCADLASVAAAEEGVRAFRGNCKGEWSETSTGLSTTEWGNRVRLADVNGDGKLDIAAAYSAGPRVWLGDGKGAWQEASTGLPAPDIHGLYWGLAVGDLNGDGRLDLVSGSQMPPQPEGCGAPGAAVCEGGGVEAYLQQADGTWQFSNTGFLPMNTLGVAIGDLDNDGKADIVAVGKRHLNEIGGVYGVFPYFGDGAGNWRLGSGSGLPDTGRERTWGVALGDINGDHVLDIAVAFGDVVHPQWRSGGKSGTPQRGKFGSVEVWKGEIGGSPAG
jgi:FG-GAP-like repeat